MTKIHTRKLQQYTQDNYNNTHKTTTTIHTRHLKIQHIKMIQDSLLTKAKKGCELKNTCKVLEYFLV